MTALLAAFMFLHITAGSFGLASGATALFVRKGSPLHRAAGNAFFVAMLMMAASGIALAVFTPAAPALNGVIGTLTLYLVATAWATVLRREGETGAFEIIALILALATGALGLAFGFEAAASPTGTKEKIPAFLYFAFGGIAILAAALDLSVVARRGLSGRQRIARHLWRMSFALLIGSIAFFVGQGAKIFPAAVRETNLLPLPVLLVAVLLLYWLVRVLFTRWYKPA